MPGEKTDVVPPDRISDELVQQLRTKFLELLEEHADEYHEGDIKRIKEDDFYCKRFIGHQKENIHYALKMVHTALKWRKDFGIHDVREDNLPSEYFKLNALFPYNKDKEGHVVLIMRVKFHKKDSNMILEQRKFIAYWVEKIERETKGTRGITILFDCMDAGISNMDLDMIRFLINLFKFYYPAYLGYILVFDMPWVFNAAWKIVKTWLPNEAVQRIKFISRPNILQYIDKDNLPVSLGGNVHFSFDEPVCMIPNGSPKNTSGSYTNLGSHTTVLSRPLQLEMSVQRHSVSSNSLNDAVIVGNILRICPASELVFSVPTHDTLSSAVLTLVNLGKKPVAYKVKTNNLMNYKVKPPAGGVLAPDGSTEINVNVLSGHKCLPSDKFLVMATEVENKELSNEELVTLWRARHRSDICEHKLRCAEGSREDSHIPVDEVDSGNSIQQLQQFCSRLEVSVIALDRKINSFYATSEAIERKQQVILYLHIGVLMLLAATLLTFVYQHVMAT